MLERKIAQVLAVEKGYQSECCEVFFLALFYIAPSDNNILAPIVSSHQARATNNKS